MLAGTEEPPYRGLLSANPAELRSAVSGADVATPTRAATPASADDAPHSETTTRPQRVTIHPTVNGMATAGCMAGSTAVN